MLSWAKLSADTIDLYFHGNEITSSLSGWRGGTLAGIFAGTATTFYLMADDAYYEAETVRFHFAKDRQGNLKWFDNRHRAMDKFGHMFSTSLFTQNYYYMARWAGFSNRASSIIAPGVALTLMTGMEIWDGHFERWGFSAGDFAANMAGGLYPVIQQNYPFFRSFDYKMSYNFFNEKSPDHGIHDYENMTFWLTANPKRLFKNTIPDWFPPFINIAFGLGLESYNSQRREFYIALDYNLKQIPVSSPILRRLFSLLDRFHFPAPAIRLAPGYVGYGLFF